MALDVFNSMIGMNADPLQPSTDPETSTDRSPSVGAIAGCVVGGVCFVAISVAIVVIIYRRRRAHVAVRNTNSAASPTTTRPSLLSPQSGAGKS